MPQTTELLTTLKKLLKRHNKTYADVAARLELSEASVKRLFSEQNLSLQRLDAICGLLELEIADLVHEMQAEHAKPISGLSHAQEKEIADDLNLVMITVCVLNRWSLQDITRHYNFSETQVIQRLAHLDRLHIIELQPGNRIKLLVAPNFKWRDDGPIMQLFRAKIESEYFRTTFTRDSEQLIVLNGMLSDASNALFQRKMAQLAKDFDTLSKDDACLPIGERKGSTLLVAIRDWDYERLFGGQRKL
ncbi:helix-turn-helix transcriptional regulator [Candidatus Thiothrix sp. Deng01]|uniref:Helix-turn-helix transcriptional regulator n=1 Tax=Candidatus Thiothrix phosphatis TaxID=3112415 RepID=A0ABU6D137_9GAMM|nr:helix-turn-helix transcriptional regulator [Candidatus Thiothrix sp. Deng01]MEB4592502.1 helix-turn-helix transcriptional regulator [Candidatus Thiothrix sp. Deng01]